MLTQKYLRENELLAIPFDKGIGFCTMEVGKYQEKLDAILELPQFQTVTKTRKNAKDPVKKEEERIKDELEDLLKADCIDKTLYDKLVPHGSQPARLYGLAKVHKSNTPVRPVLSMPGSAYHEIGIQVAEWLSTVPECVINTTTKEIADSLNDIQLDEEEEVASFDIKSL